MKLSLTLIAWTRRLLLTLASLATLVVLLLCIESWRGNRAWKTVVSEMEARGISLTLDATRSPPVPDAENFFQAPGVAELLLQQPPTGKAQRSPTQRVLLPESLRTALVAADALEVSKPLDPDAIRDRLIRHGLLGRTAEPAVAAILTVIEPANTALTALQKAARERTQAAAPARTLREFSSMAAGATFDLSKILALRARLELAAGKFDAAFEDTRTLLQLANRVSISQPSTLLQLLVATAISGQAVTVITEALPIASWDAKQLAILRQDMAETKWTSAMANCLHSELAITLAVIEATPTSELKEMAVKRARLLDVPGWRQQNKATIARLGELWLATIDVSGDRLNHQSLERMREVERQLSRSSSPYGMIARLYDARLSSVVVNFAHDNDTLREGLVALAVEQFRLEHGKYPSALDELVAAGLLPSAPKSAVNSEPMRLTLLDGGGFELSIAAPDDKRKPLRVAATRPHDQVAG